MKRTMQTLIVAVFVILTTATFGFAEYAATGTADFPYFHLGALIIGGLVIISLKYKFQMMYTGEVVGAFGLYTMLVALFTSPVIEAVKTMVS